jgi:large repetitive protein
MNSCSIFLACERRQKALPFLAAFFLLMGYVPALAQGAKVTALSEPIKEEDSDHWRARDEWFMRGRRVPGQSSAALLYKAQQQKMRLRARRAAAAMRAQTGVVPFSSTSAGWDPLGPAPLASDASGVGIQDYNWVSGRATAVAVDPADQTGNTVFLGGAFGGLWKSTNAGAASPSPANVTWTPLIDDQSTLAVGAIAIQPGNSNPFSSVALVGTGEANSSGDSYYGRGILRSADGGSTWTLINSADSGAHPFLGLGFTKIAFSTGNPNLVVAASAASSVGIETGAITNSTRGLYTSVNGGQTWSLHVPVDPNSQPISPAASVTAVLFNPAMGLFYAAVRYHGIYSSPDGATWSRLPNQPGGTKLSTTACATTLPQTPTCPIYRGEFAIVPGRNEMYVWYVDVNENDQGIWQSTNGGASWTSINDTGITNCGDQGNSGCGTQQGAYNLELAAVPSGAGTDLYAGAINIFKCSINSSNPTCSSSPFLNLTHVYGCSAIARVHPDQHGVAFPFPLPSGKALMYFANDGGIYRALDGFALTTGNCGGSNPFDSLNQTLGSMTQFVAFSQHPTDAKTILGGTQDNGSPATSQATTNSHWLNVNAGDGGYNAITPSSPSDWFVSNPDIPPHGLEIDHCSLGINCHTGDFATGAVVTSVQLGNDDGDFYFPYILDPQSDHELLVGTCRVWRGGPSTSSTGAYTALSNNLETGSTAACTGNEVNLVRAIAAGGPKDAKGFSNVVYATTSGTGPVANSPTGGEVRVTTNAASGNPALFTNVTGSINPSHFVISSVAIDSSDATGQTAYVTIMGFGVSHVWKTTNGGQTWSDFTGTGLPDAPANAVVVDSNTTPSTVYVGTDVGVFSSSTASASWTEVGPQPSPGASGFLPNVPVTALKIFKTSTSRRLRASTYGRGIWEFVLFAGPDYVIDITDTPQTIFPTQTATFHGTLTGQNGYTSSVALSCTGSVPPGCTPAPTPITATASPISFTVTTGTVTAVNNYSFNVHGVGNDTNTVTHDAPVLLQVVDFALGSPAPASVQIVRGFPSQQIQMQVTGQGAFNDVVTLSCSSAVVGVTCTFDNPTPTVSTAAPVTVNMTVNTTIATLLGSGSVTVSATVSGAPAAKTRNLPITVTSSGYAMTISNTPLKLLDGQSGAFNGTLTALGGYSNLVNVSCQGGTLPSPCTGTSATPGVSGQPFSVTVGNTIAGNFSFTIQGVGTDSNSFTQTIPVSLVVAQDFVITASTSSQTVTAGKTATYSLSVAPKGLRFDSAVTFSCSGQPSLTQCSFSASSVIPGNASQPVTMTITTTAPVASLRRGRMFYAAWLSLPGVAFVFAGFIRSEPRRRRITKLAAIGLFSLVLLLLPSCGGGGSSGGGPPPQPGTPPGTYPITVMGNSASVAPETVIVNLTVQ